MCFNKEVSIVSYILSSIFSTLLLFNSNSTKQHIGLFFLIISQVQLMEYFMWLDPKCTTGLNHSASKTLHLILMFQPMVILLGAIRFKSTTIPDKILWILVILCSIPIMYSDYLSVVYNRKLCSKEHTNGHLNWDLEGKYDKKSLYHTPILGIFYMIGVIVPWFFIKEIRLRNIFLGIIFVSLILSKIVDSYSFGKISIYRNIISTWESIWCWFGSISPLIIYLV